MKKNKNHEDCQSSNNWNQTRPQSFYVNQEAMIHNVNADCNLYDEDESKRTKGCKEKKHHTWKILKQTGAQPRSHAV